MFEAITAARAIMARIILAKNRITVDAGVMEISRKWSIVVVQTKITDKCMAVIAIFADRQLRTRVGFFSLTS